MRFTTTVTQVPPPVLRSFRSFTFFQQKRWDLDAPQLWFVEQLGQHEDERGIITLGWTRLG